MTVPCPYAEDYTDQEHKAFFEIDFSGDLTEYYFSNVAVSFLKTYTQTER